MACIFGCSVAGLFGVSGFTITLQQAKNYLQTPSNPDPSLFLKSLSRQVQS
jgi:hypothetical protein